MANVIAAAAAFTACVAGGAVLAGRREEKTAFLSSLCDFNSDYIKEIGFARGEISNLVTKKYRSEKFNHMLEFYGKSDFCIESEKVVLSVKACEIYPDIKEYFKRIGKTDALTSAKEAERYAAIFGAALKKSEECDGKYKIIYKKLGVIAGLAAFVIVV